MPKNKKNFIDKKNSVTFRLVQRTQNDPLFVDPDAPQYVLVEKKTKEQVEIDFERSKGQKNKLSTDERKVEQAKYGVYFDDDYDYLQHLIDVDEVQRMKGVDIVSKDVAVLDNGAEEGVAGPSNPKLMLPSSMFESKVEEKIDLSKRAALPVGPQLDWDPDVVEAMDDDFDFDNPDNQIDDDFVAQAMFADGQNDEDDSEMGGFDGNLARIEHDSDKESVCGYAGSDDDDEEYDRFPTNGKELRDLMAKPQFKKFLGYEGKEGFDEDDAKTYKTAASQHFTEYSMSSSVMPRNENLQTLDERFENLFIREYGEEEMGALDGDEELENVGYVDPFESKVMEKLVNEFQEAKEANFGVQYELDKEAADFAKARYANYDSNNDDSEQEEIEYSDEEFETITLEDPARKGDKDRFDCESILSTYSNTMYHPKVLKDTDRYGNILHGRPRNRNHIRIDPKTGLPMLESTLAPTARNLAALDRDCDNRTVKTDMSRLTELSIRPKNETIEEKRERKRELREFRAARRLEKKANKLAFSEENRRLHKVDINNASQKKVSVI